MQDYALNQFTNVVAIGGGHGLGRVLSSLSFLGSKLTGIVATTDNGGSTGRLRQEQDCIAWGDLRNCLSQLASRPSVGSMLFEYRFGGNSELSQHNLGNLILLALDELCVRPLEAVNLIRNMLSIETQLIPMSEQPTHLVAIQSCGSRILGEVEVDEMTEDPIALSLEPMVEATQEAYIAIENADLIILGPGSFLTSIMPPLLLPKISEAISQSNAKIVLIENLTEEPSAAANFSLEKRLEWFKQVLGNKAVDHVLCDGESYSTHGHITHYPLRSRHHIALHDRKGLIEALSLVARREL
ncbi:uridine diphosphate-N-acetylglucosamine-binding protein YvcK [Shewanella sp. Isolate11]|uniref:uridine diphosphate-N-acetylglucosamine-binding protein YvcK n=1 Tax=Shewanella sp. Isolate11 TaxID=2908530 RepID=UPI001EFC760F|nr:uridine diphosphate-N-acetylglucosamine-binding protein YvcK [Shewanella sp. Isolate11]MCG9696666.1 uridine diphosphate-N-acetylglucosamine-binding protein YvcK [Shewanella sp. Isolate11]